MPSVADPLDYPPEARLLILNCADLGLCHAATVGVYEALREGIGTSASLIVPAPWARESASRFRGDDVGVQLTLNAELDRYRWGPITQAPSLLDGDGGFPRTVTDLWGAATISTRFVENAGPRSSEPCCGASTSAISIAISMPWSCAQTLRRLCKAAVGFGLPLRLLGAEAEPNVGFPVRQLASDEGVLYADRFATLPAPASRQSFVDLLAGLEPGVTEVTLRPAIDTPELRAIATDWHVRVADHVLLVADRGFGQLISDAGVTLIGYRQLATPCGATDLPLSAMRPKRSEEARPAPG